MQRAWTVLALVFLSPLVLCEQAGAWGYYPVYVGHASPCYGHPVLVSYPCCAPVFFSPAVPGEKLISGTTVQGTIYASDGTILSGTQVNMTILDSKGNSIPITSGSLSTSTGTYSFTFDPSKLQTDRQFSVTFQQMGGTTVTTIPGNNPTTSTAQYLSGNASAHRLDPVVPQ